MSRCSHAKPQAARAGFTLIAVLVIVGSALLVATSLMFIAQAEVAGAAQTGRVAQSRAMIESGLEVIMLRLDAQRELILSGEQPQLDQQYELWESGGSLGVVRVLAVTADGARLEPQAGMIDVNADWLTSDALVATGMIEPAMAEAIMQYRQQVGMIQSVAELLHVEGMTAEMLYGPVEELLRDQTSLVEGDVVERVSARFVSDEPRGLSDILTVFAVEPDLQRDGRRRINLNVSWSNELGSRLDGRFGEGAGEIVRTIMESTSFDDMATLIRVLIQLAVPIEDWADIVDALTTAEETYAFGRIDLNSAGEAVLMSLPEMTPEQAAAIMRTRETLTDDERNSIVWPVLRGIVEPAVFAGWADAVTTRSWTYRVRLAAGEVDADDPTADFVNPVVFEAVIDLAAPRARVAYLRDITLLRAAAMLVAAERPGNRLARDWYEEEERFALEEDAAPMGHGLGLNDDDDFDVMDWPDEEESWPTDDLADEVNGVLSSDAPTSRQRLGRWRGG